MALLLHIETATEICSVALSEGDRLLSISEADAPYTHGEKINLLIRRCLTEAGRRMAELDAVAVSSGPGSYTALRIGTATAKGICYGLQAPLIAVDTLRALARAAFEREGRPALYIPMIDARRMEVYTAVFDEEQRPLTEAQALVIEANSFSAYRQEGRELVLCGNGAEKCREVLGAPGIHFSEVRCSARHLIYWAAKHYSEQAFADLAYYAPFYLKPPNITRPKKKL